MKEIWKDIEGYEGLYQVSNTGKVRSLNYNKTKAIKELALHKDGRSRIQVTVQKGDKSVFLSVPRLVAQAFIPNPNNLPQVNHKDENPANNTVWINDDGSIDYDKTNLEWCTSIYNLCYGTRLQRISKALKTKIRVYDGSDIVGIFDSVGLAAKFFGFPRPCISRALAANKKYKNLIWKYERDVV